MNRVKESGTLVLKARCTDRALEDPASFASSQGGFRVTFLKDPYTPERLRRMGLSERQIKAVLYVKEWGSIGNKEYQELTGVKERTATSELGDLVKKGILIRIGTTGRGALYAARKAQKPQ